MLIVAIYFRFSSSSSGKMAPNIAVPMNFGIRLLESPTHSTLELKTSEEVVLYASSVILSFNSPVIDHMTTTLQLTSVDMKEFSIEAVRYFVDAAYSGETPSISRDLFRDINKMANVFKMSWLVTRCSEQFFKIADVITESMYEDLIFLFEEAAFVLCTLNSRQLVSIALNKIRSLNIEQNFMKRYLEDMTSLSCQHLDLITELAGPEVNYIVQPLTEQLAAQLFRGETILPANCKYLLENIDLSFCQGQSIDMFENLFDILVKFSASKMDLHWTLCLYRGTTNKSLTAPSTNVVQFSDNSVITNLYHTLDFNLTFDEVVDWLGNSEVVTNLLMFFEGIWTWMWANKDTMVNKCTPKFLNTVNEIRIRRNWHAIHLNNKYLLDFEPTSVYSKAFFEEIKECTNLCSSDDSVSGPGCQWFEVVMDGSDGVARDDIHHIFTTGSTITFFKYPKMKDCSKEGDCGFI